MVIEESPLVILMTAMIDSGHLNSCLGIGSLLRKRGHQVYFAHFPKNLETIERQGIQFISLYDYRDDNLPMSDEGPHIASIFEPRFQRACKFNPLEQLKEEVANKVTNVRVLGVLERSKGENIAMNRIIEKMKPDLCLADYLWPLPWMFTAKCPVIFVKSTNPIDLYNGPPIESGYSVHSPPSLWKQYETLYQKSRQPLMDKVKELFNHFQVEFKSRYHVKNMGIYIYPESLDYHDQLGPPVEKWVRLDSSIRKPESTEFQIPEKLINKPGKLIYISMGTLASSVTQLMSMIITPLAASPHRFIISTGSNGDSIKLYDNMWGAKFINQLALLPKVDLFITHGGSNSLIEGLATGKPLLVIPQFGDQLDNGQRIVDLGLGVKINLWEFSGDKLLKAIEHVLNDDKIHSNVARISKELEKSDSSDKIITLIEHLARTKASPL